MFPNCRKPTRDSNYAEASPGCPLLRFDRAELLSRRVSPRNAPPLGQPGSGNTEAVHDVREGAVRHLWVLGQPTARQRPLLCCPLPLNATWSFQAAMRAGEITELHARH